MADVTDISKVHQVGNSRAVLIPKNILDELLWRKGDRVALRVSAGKLTVERIPMERLAVLAAPRVDADVQSHTQAVHQ